MGMHMGKQRGTPEKNVSKVANSLSFLTSIVGHSSVAQANSCFWVLRQNP